VLSSRSRTGRLQPKRWPARPDRARPPAAWTHAPRASMCRAHELPTRSGPSSSLPPRHQRRGSESDGGTSTKTASHCCSHRRLQLHSTSTAAAGAGPQRSRQRSDRSSLSPPARFVSSDLLMACKKTNTKTIAVSFLGSPAAHVHRSPTIRNWV
jgi:hypothetical protein